MILMYHKIHPNSPTMWWVTVNDFYRQMSEIASKKVVYLDDYEIGNEEQVVITFDGVYKNVLEFALPILKYFNYPFELFITSDYIGLDNEFDNIEPNSKFTSLEELSLLVDGGGRLQWHTKSHINFKKSNDLETINNELKIPDQLLNIDYNGFKWFAYPYGEFNEIVVNEVKKRFTGAVSCNQGNTTDKFILNRITVVNKTSLRKNKIACIIASYNYGHFLIEAIESVLKQTILPNEILISDDCSDDETRIIAESYVKKYPELISYNRNEKNMGIVGHFNKAISLTKSEYVFFLGADNRLLSNYVEECSKILDKSGEIAIAYTDYALFGSRAKLKYQTFAVDRKDRVIKEVFYQILFPEFENKEDLVLVMQSGNFIHGSSMFKRKVFFEVGGYVETTTAEDYNLFKRMIEKGWTAIKAKNTNFEYRQHDLGQANNVLSIQNRMMFYKNAYLAKDTFEKSKFYIIAYKMYRIKFFLNKNYKNPKAIALKFKKIFLRCSP